MDSLAGLKIAAYARFSSDNQRDTSIDDQVRLGREFVVRRDGLLTDELVLTDYAVSGVSRAREGFERLLKLIQNQPPLHGPPLLRRLWPPDGGQRRQLRALLPLQRSDERRRLYEPPSTWTRSPMARTERGRSCSRRSWPRKAGSPEAANRPGLQMSPTRS
jgi:Resolvase, N terminal domain